MRRLPLWTALQGRWAQSLLCGFPPHCFLAFQLNGSSCKPRSAHMFILESLRHYFLGRVTVYLAQLVLSAEPYPFFCLQTLIPVTRKPARWVACSRWSTSHSYLFVCLERKKNIPFLFFLPSWEQSVHSSENWWHPSPPLSYITSCFYASCIFNLLQLSYGLENPLTEWWLFSWNSATWKAVVVINSAVM